jgi:hypothetical protein
MGVALLPKTTFAETNGLQIEVDNPLSTVVLQNNKNK